MGSAVIVHAASVVQQRAHVQEAADAIALAAVSHHINTVQELARQWHVMIRVMECHDNTVHVEVESGIGRATSSAITCNIGP